MPFHIDSNDSGSNTIYDDVWSFNSSLRGSYNVIDQYMGTGNIPWMWAACNQLVINAGISSGTVSFDYASIGKSTDIATITSSFQTSINALINTFVGDDYRTCVVSYVSDTTGTYYVFTFNDLVTLAFSNPISTSKYVFNKTMDISSTAFNIYTTYMTVLPKFLELYIAESITEYTTARNRYPTLLLSTGDIPVTNQIVIFRDPTKSLTIKIYRLNVPYVCPITNKWDVILS